MEPLNDQSALAAARRLRKDRLGALIDALWKQGRTVIGPRRREGRVDWAVVRSAEELADDYVQTVTSAKVVVDPPVEKLFEYEEKSSGIELRDFDPAQAPEIVLLGVRPCDAAGFGALGAIFNWDCRDELFNARLAKTTVIGLSCRRADEYCFCTSVGGGPGDTAGSDILLTQLDAGDYLAEVLTDKGRQITEAAPDLFEPAPEGIRKEDLLAVVPVRFDPAVAKEKLEAYFQSPLWAERSLKCLGCGACAFVCPTCACFDIQDEAHGRRGARFRCWDSCGFSLFTLHTSGHNPRDAQSQRWRQRLMHKFVYMPERQRVLGCVGCGRCSRACPADMNLVEHLAAIMETGT